MAKNWKKLIDDMDMDVGDVDELLAVRIPMGSVKGGLFKQDVIINPGEVAVLVEDGKIQETLTQTKLRKFGGGVKGWIDKAMGRGEDEYLIFIDGTEHILDFPIEETSKDQVNIQGVCTLRFTIDTDNPQNLINIMKGRKLTLEELRKKMKPELRGTFSSTVSKYDAEEFKGNRDIIRELEQDAMVWMKKTFSKWGIEPVKIFTNWEKSDYDKLQEYRKKKEMMSEKKDIQQQEELEELRREYESSKEKQEKKHDLKLGKVKKEGEISKEKKSNELEVDNMEFQQDIEHKKTKHEVEHEAEKDKIETALNATEKMKDIDVDKFQKTTLAEEELEKEHEQEMKEKDVEAEKERVRKGVETTDERLKQLQEEIHELEMKIADSPPEKIEALQTMLDRKKEQYEKMQEEGTKRQLGTVGGEAAEKYAEAEGEKHNMDTYKEAEDRERKHQKEMTGEASDMMESAKQENPDYVQGGSGQSSGVNVVNVEEGGKQTQQRSSPSGDICPNCGGDIQKGWDACPQCGQDLGNGQNRCPNCGGDIKEGWEACPQCGEDLGNGQNRCPNCGGDIKEGWEACPQCGEALGSGPQNKCPNCGEEIESEWKVCPGCGNVL